MIRRSQVSIGACRDCSSWDGDRTARIAQPVFGLCSNEVAARGVPYREHTEFLTFADFGCRFWSEWRGNFVAMREEPMTEPVPEDIEHKAPPKRWGRH